MADHAHRQLVQQFPILNQMIFLNHAGVAPISGPAAEALRRYADQGVTQAYVGSGWYAQVHHVKKMVAKLIGARGEHEIAFMPNTSTGLNMVAGGLDWREGDDVVITNVEYPANRYPWENIKRKGVSVIEVAQHSDGRVHAEDVMEAITDRTRVVAISHVQYSSGCCIDLKPIAKMVHLAGGYLCIDAIQSVGAIPVDVQAMDIDFLSADGHKWMLGPEGCGIFYCREDLIEMIHPPVVGWMCMVNAEQYGDYQFELTNDGRRFEPGSYNIPGILSLGASVELLLHVGMDEVWSAIESLTTCLCDGLTEIGYPVFSPRGHGECSGIVAFDVPLSPHGVKPEMSPMEIVARLAKRGIVIVEREGHLRASPHYYNTPQQIRSLIEALDSISNG